MAAYKPDPIVIADQTGGFSTGNNEIPSAGVKIPYLHGEFEVQYVKGSETSMLLIPETKSSNSAVWLEHYDGTGTTSPDDRIELVGATLTATFGAMVPFIGTGNDKQYICPPGNLTRINCFIAGTPDGSTSIYIAFHPIAQG